MRIKLNFITSLILQLSSIVAGLILPRLIISSFGSEVNGLISSITQLLSFISLLEGGLGAVVLAELYKPIEKRNIKLIGSILTACENFFYKIGIIFLIYTFLLMFLYPFYTLNQFSYQYTCSLVLILSITTLVQYLFSITNKLFLQADQKIYICNIVSILIIIINLILSILIIKFLPNIHIVKLGSSIVYLIQPFIFNWYVKKHYTIIKDTNIDTSLLKNRWSGFSQNLAHFINMNTDVILITFCLGLKEVSVYSVYMLALNAMRTIIASVSNSYQSVLGKYIALENTKLLRKKFQTFEMGLWEVSCVLFATCLLLINPFVKLYTSGINDVNYYRPIFAWVMVCAQFVYCGRESYRLLVLAGGKFKETNFGSIIEAILNIVISIILLLNFGIEGVAIGTLVAISYRLIYFIVYLKNHIIKLNVRHTITLLIISINVFVINFIIYFYIQFPIYSFIDFLIYGIIVFIFEIVLMLILSNVVLIFKKYLYK
ncbi:oligosaccharide flippase family protein [Candidatus Stoquefichus massiliensis]|uniref:oligosaccharide flippase family protein n=1 Tax=Candidatus Stoquefichus massiliensis TaxID=1470350 RepID=UPI0004BA8FD5|nr:oligosaccharide flippase family protein [Candidatus Stoquefichus massiliensis]